jgi:hypothetical protein
MRPDLSPVRNKKTVFKFLFGAYAVEAMLPIIRRAATKEEEALIRVANVCLGGFYILFITLLLFILFNYR